MNILSSPSEIRSATLALKKKGKVALIPTMGALHEGHLSLIKTARKHALHIIVSIFVNPKQFSPREDFSDYPRPLDQDIQLLEREKVSLLFQPRPETIYPDGFETKVQVQHLEKIMCGKSRPGHFEGVCTVVLKLIQLIPADYIVMGEKDFQQLKIIERMISDLNLPISLIGSPLLRDESGAPYSSRNSYLDPEGQKIIARVGQILLAEQQRIKKERPSAKEIVEFVTQNITKTIPEITLDYIEFRNSKDLAEVESTVFPSILAIAFYFQGRRFIDNVIIH